MRTKAIATLLVLAGILQTGCALQRPTVDGYRIEGPVPAANDGNERSVTRLLLYSRRLMQASPSGRLALLETAKSAYQRQPNPANAARLALAYGQPNYKGYAPENGWRYVQNALAADDGYWGPAAVAYLRQFAALCVDNDHVRAQLDKATKQIESTRQQLTRTRRALTRSRGALTHTQRELTRTQRKLHALTRIETQLKP